MILPLKANEVKVLESTAITQSRVIEKLQELLKKQVIATGNPSVPSVPAKPSKWDAPKLLKAAKASLPSEKFVRAVNAAMERIGGEHEAAASDEYLHQLEEELTRLRFGKEIANDKIEDAAEGGVQQVSRFGAAGEQQSAGV